MNYEQNYYSTDKTKKNIFNLHPFYLETSPNNSTGESLRNGTWDIIPSIFQKKKCSDKEQDPFNHDVIPLINTPYFRLVLRIGDSALDLPNIQGNTLLHQALEAKDYSIVEDLLNRNPISINFMNVKGMTPLMIAIENEMESVIELLLLKGAAYSINQANPHNLKTALHLASTLKDSTITRMLLKYGAGDSIEMEDKKHYTPVQRAIITRRVDTLKAMLEVKPEIAKNFNKPDFFGVTHFQRAARSGCIETMGLMLAHSIEEEIKVDLEASFTEGDLEACQARAANLDSIPIDQIGFPLVIAQNYCNVMVSLNNGKILKIPHADALQVRNHIKKKIEGTESVVHEEANELTIYLSPGHGFLRLECRNCRDNQPYNGNIGFYPTGNFFGTRMVVPKKEMNMFFEMVSLYEEATQDQKGHLQNENWYENDSDSRNSLKIMFYVNDDQAKAALDMMKTVSESCAYKPERSCRYNAIQRNCVSFLQEVFTSVGGKGNFADFFTDEQLNYGHLEAPSRLYEFKAVNYAYLSSRGLPHYLQSGLYQNINNLYNQLGYGRIIGKDAFLKTFPLPHKFQSLEQTGWNFNSNLLLGVALAVGVSKAFDYVSKVRCWFGKSVSKDEFSNWYQDGRARLDGLLAKLDAVEDQIFDILNFIDNEVDLLNDNQEGLEENEVLLHIYEEEKSKWKKISEKRIDLLCDSVALEQELKKLYKSNSIPSKTYLERFDKQILQLSTRYKGFTSEVELILEDLLG